MNLITDMKKNKLLQSVYSTLLNAYFCLLTIVSPELNTKARFRSAYGRKLSLNNPQSFNEKLLWLKLKKYINDPLVKKCADKYRVREYIEECGYGTILNRIYGVYEHACEIPWDSLPNSFVLKWNFGAGMNIICKDKTILDVEGAIKQLNSWERVKYWLPHSEMQYKGAKKKIICEEYLVDRDNPDVIPDFKVYCFHGEPRAIFVMHDRGHGIKSEFFDVKWNLLENTDKYLKPKNITQKPKCLQEMLEVSRKISSPFPFVRCDYYIVNGKLYFGELTFTPAGGLYTSTTKIEGKDMSDFLHVPC